MEILYWIAGCGIVLFIMIYMLLAIKDLKSELTSTQYLFSLNREKVIYELKLKEKADRLSVLHEKYLNKKVIALSLEQADPIIGICVDFQQSLDSKAQHPIIQDYLKNEKIVFYGEILIYNEDLFNVLYKLNYKERLILLKSVTLSSLNDEKILNNGLTKYEAKEQLEKNGFYKLENN